MFRAYEERFLTEYADNSPQEIIQAEGRKSLAIIARIREQSRKDELRLKAAIVFVDRYIPAKTSTELSGTIEIKLTKKIVRVAAHEPAKGRGR